MFHSSQKMTTRIVTPVTNKPTLVKSLIRADIGNYPTDPTKFTVIHKRPILSMTKTTENNIHQSVFPNAMCRFVHHPVRNGTTKGLPTNELVIPKSEVVIKSSKNRSTNKKLQPMKRLKRSLSADNIIMFQAPPAKRPFPVQIWFNKDKLPRVPVATAYWQDSPLHTSIGFVFTKLLEASQAYRYLQLQGRPRKYLHLTGGGITAINNAPQRKPEISFPPMTVKIHPMKASELVPNVRKNSSTNRLPSPPPLISLRADLRTRTPPQQDQPLELCKRRKTSQDSPPHSPILSKSISPQPLNLVQNSRIKKGVHLSAIPIVQLQEPLDLATPSPTIAFKHLNLNEKLSPLALISADEFRQRLVMVLQVLLGHRRLQNLGHPHVGVDDILARILDRAGIAQTRNADVRENWLKFLRLCVNNEDAWKREGWDHKSADAILNEIYEQDVIPVLRKTEPATPTSRTMIEEKT